MRRTDGSRPHGAFGSDKALLGTCAQSSMGMVMGEEYIIVCYPTSKRVFVCDEYDISLLGATFSHPQPRTSATRPRGDELRT